MDLTWGKPKKRGLRCEESPLQARRTSWCLDIDLSLTAVLQSKSGISNHSIILENSPSQFFPTWRTSPTLLFPISPSPPKLRNSYNSSSRSSSNSFQFIQILLTLLNSFTSRLLSQSASNPNPSNSQELIHSIPSRTFWLWIGQSSCPAIIHSILT